MARPYQTSTHDFNAWLNQKVWISGDQKMCRRDWIPSFADCLTSFMKRKGYVMDHRWKKGHLQVAKWLYAIQVHEVARRNRFGPIQYPEIIHRNLPEDYDMFESAVSIDDLEIFLKGFSLNDDLNMSTPSGTRVFCEIGTFLYTFLDLDSSKLGRKIERILEKANETDSDTEYDKVDTYIQDANEGWHGGRGQKV